MVTNNTLAPDLQQPLQRAIVAFANEHSAAATAELAARPPHIRAMPGSYRTSGGEVVGVEAGSGPLLRLTRRGVAYTGFSLGNGIGYAPGLDTYVTGSSTGGLGMLSLYEREEARPFAAHRYAQPPCPLATIAAIHACACTMPARRSAMKTRRYEVSGIDDLGDVHMFGTHDRERAEGVAEIMREDLENVMLVEDRD
jgi:hypothetical protein